MNWGLSAKAVMFGGLLALGLGGAARADSITLSTSDVGTSFGVQFDGNVETLNIPDLSSIANFELVSVVGGTWTFDVDLTMTATNGVGARVSGLGFNTNPDIVSATSSGLFNTAVLAGSFPNQFGAIDVCFKDGGGSSNCQGGGSGGTFNTGSFTLALTFDGSPTSITIDNFGVRYQSITGVDAGTSGTGTGTLTLVPEPLTWSLMILAFACVGARVRSSNKQAA